MATEQSLLAVIRAARPSFRNPADKAAFAVHAAFSAAGYTLHAAGLPALADDALTASPADEVGMEGWNEMEDEYAFVYSKPDKDLKKVLVKCLAVDEKLLVSVLKQGDSAQLQVEIDVGEYVESDGGTNYSSQFKNLGKLASLVNKEILGKLDGASASRKPSSSETNLREDRPRIGVDDHDYPYVSPSTGFVVPPVPDYGGSDLFPGPGAGMYPSRGGFGDGSMLVGPHDPRFFGGRSGEPDFHGDRPGVPPGARFDPYGPPGVPGFEPNRFTRNPRRPGGGTHPDLEHFPGGADYI